MSFDLAIIGAGPAGMSAAIEAGRLGLSVVVLDEQPRAGGQIYRKIGDTPVSDRAVLGPDYYHGQSLAEAFRRCDCRKLTGVAVWQIDDDGSVFYSRGGRSESLQAQHILIATGAQERPCPIRGWQLPGVMTAGAAQIMLKHSGVAAEGAVFAGSGPLLYLVASQYLKAGISIKAILDTTPKRHYLAALKKLPAALKQPGYLLKGLGLIWQLRRSGIPFVSGVTELEAVSEAGVLNSVRYRKAGQNHEIQTDHLFLHQGVIPQVNLALASGCEHRWDEQQLCWQPVTDEWGQSSARHISIAGDGGGIGGAKAAAIKGRVVAAGIAVRLGKLTPQQCDTDYQKEHAELSKELAVRPFLDRLYRPIQAMRLPQHEETLVCRCEEVSFAGVKAALSDGCMGPNQLKSFTRCGMGSCQGRQCGPVVSELIAAERGKPVSEVGYYRVRAPIKPVTLADIAALAEANEERV